MIFFFLDHLVDSKLDSSTCKGCLTSDFLLILGADPSGSHFKTYGLNLNDLCKPFIYNLHSFILMKFFFFFKVFLRLPVESSGLANIPRLKRVPNTRFTFLHFCLLQILSLYHFISLLIFQCLLGRFFNILHSFSDCC